jgi:sugar phosphate isomerase/epimerase
MKYAQTAIKRAGISGIEAMVFGSGGARRIPDGFSRGEAQEQFIEFAKSIAPFASAAGVVVVIEPLNKAETNFINSLAEGAQIVEAVGEDSIKLLADIYHMLREDEDPGEIVKYGTMLRHAHIAEKENRTPPGVQGDDFRPFFEAFKAAGYAGPIAIECRWGEEYDAQAKRAVELIRELTT